MGKALLDAASLPNLADGIVGRMIEKSIGEVVRDLDDRGHDGQKRTVTLTLEFKAKDEKIAIDATVTHKLPAYRPATTMAKFNNAAGALEFNPEVAAEPDQGTLGDLETGWKKAR